MSKNRLEAFSDGVLAVAITLLVLDIKVPAPVSESGATLGHALLKQWPIYAAYATSFITIGIIWINHHAMLSRLRLADHGVLVLNLFLLMSIGVLPFATSLLSAYLKESQGQHLAAALYSASLLLMGTLFALMHRHMLFRRPELLAEELPHHRRRQIFTRALSGLVPYAIATALAPVSAYATLAICLAVALFYALPVAIGGEPASQGS